MWEGGRREGGGKGEKRGCGKGEGGKEAGKVKREDVGRGGEGRGREVGREGGRGEGRGGGGGMCVFNQEHIKGALPYTPSGKVRPAERAEACSHKRGHSALFRMFSI
jgi:hypothetical protein